MKWSNFLTNYIISFGYSISLFGHTLNVHISQANQDITYLHFVSNALVGVTKSNIFQDRW